MSPESQEEMYMWFIETNGSADLMAVYFNISLGVAKKLIKAWEIDDESNDDNTENWENW